MKKDQTFEIYILRQQNNAFLKKGLSLSKMSILIFFCILYQKVTTFKPFKNRQTPIIGDRTLIIPVFLDPTYYKKDQNTHSGGFIILVRIDEKKKKVN